MRIATLNTWKNQGDYDRRLEAMAAGLADLRADLICLQECFAGRGVATAASLAARLGMRAHAAPARRKLREHGGRQVMSTSGLAILTRAPRASAELLALVSDPRDGQRIAQRLNVDVGGQRLRVLNLHLTHLRSVKADAMRAAQLTAAVGWARTDWAGPIVVCGDLNMGRGDPAFGLLEAAAGDELGATLHAAAPAGRAIDHAILLQPGGLRVARRFLALHEPDAAGRYPSDHACVVIDLST